MKVKELIAKLKTFDPEQLVVCYSEDEGLRTDEGPIQILEVKNLSEVEAEASRLNDGAGKPWLKFETSGKSSKFVLIEVTSDV